MFRRFFVSRNTMKDFAKIKELFEVDTDCGIDEKDILKAEADLSITLPKTLKEYYLQLGKHPLNCNQDFLLLPEHKDNKSTQSIFLEGDMIVFYRENQSCHMWGIKTSDAGIDNPPVYRKENDDVSQWELDTDNLNDFLIAMAFWQLNFSYPNTAYCLEVEPSEIEKPLLQYQKENYVFKKWNVEFYRNTGNHLLSLHKIEEENYHLYIMDKTSKGLYAIIDQFDIEWDDIEEDE